MTLPLLALPLKDPSPPPKKQTNTRGPGSLDTCASRLLFVIMLMREDLPTLDLWWWWWCGGRCGGRWMVA